MAIYLSVAPILLVLCLSGFGDLLRALLDWKRPRDAGSNLGAVGRYMPQPRCPVQLEYLHEQIAKSLQVAFQSAAIVRKSGTFLARLESARRIDAAALGRAEASPSSRDGTADSPAPLYRSTGPLPTRAPRTPCHARSAQHDRPEQAHEPVAAKATAA
jgi:hypothetical protein